MLPLPSPVLELDFVEIILRYLAQIRSSAYVHVITLNDTECFASIFWQYSNLGKQILMI